ncbi:MAG: cyclic 2,3-diphosphoglycerate synthase [Candidatus Eremiobacteraeota bacterium]|nr:cyclic 2,3-diphosphoglycerate synthase [Candidatus Eremiobacteraeota bacterium]
MKTRVIIMGAAGRDFHNFNSFFRSREEYEVVAFTATQIPNIEGRVYPPQLSGPLYPGGIPIFSEEELPRLIKEKGIHQVVFAYSDVSHQEVMHKASTVVASGADFKLLGPSATCLKAKVPVVSVCAVRTGVGKSQTTRKVCDIIKNRGYRVVAVRHPMPYGDLTKQVCQRFAEHSDLDRYQCTIEEREEYAPHIERKTIVYAGIDYQVILEEAQKEADVILWDGGNNDFPFYTSDLQIVLVDPLRPGHEVRYYPGEANLKMADCIIINKMDSATPMDIEEVKSNITINNSRATVIEATSPISCDDPALVRGKRVLVIEDGPTLTHGEMGYGAGVVMSKNLGAAELVDPRPYAKGSIREVFRKFPHIGPLLPAMGYSDHQIQELKETIEETPCDLVVIGTPIDLRKVMELSRPSVRITYELQEIGKPDLEEVLTKIFTKLRERRSTT